MRKIENPKQRIEGGESADGDIVFNLSWVVGFCRSQFKMVMLCLIILLVCLYTLYNLGDFRQKCNDHWVREVQRCNCLCGLEDNSSFQSFNEKPDYLGIFNVSGGQT